MCAMNLFQLYINTIFNGNQTLAAQALGITRSMVSRIARGQRNVSPALAKRAEAVSGGRFRKEIFIWPELAEQEPAFSPSPHSHAADAGVGNEYDSVSPFL